MIIFSNHCFYIFLFPITNKDHQHCARIRHTLRISEAATYFFMAPTKKCTSTFCGLLQVERFGPYVAPSVIASIPLIIAFVNTLLFLPETNRARIPYPDFMSLLHTMRRVQVWHCLAFLTLPRIYDIISRYMHVNCHEFASNIHFEQTEK
jgi:hypothetical protein